jgi:hypothetical protein
MGHQVKVGGITNHPADLGDLSFIKIFAKFNEMFFGHVAVLDDGGSGGEGGALGGGEGWVGVERVEVAQVIEGEAEVGGFGAVEVCAEGAAVEFGGVQGEEEADGGGDGEAAFG